MSRGEKLLRVLGAGARRVREILRLLNGDTAYARYLDHWQTDHRGSGRPLNRADFFAREIARRWDGVRRCC